MALEDEILKAGNILDDAMSVVKKGTSIFDEVKASLGLITPVPATPPLTATQPVLQTASTPTPGTQANVGLLIVIAVLAYIVLS